jgi:hypothetical protein
LPTWSARFRIPKQLVAPCPSICTPEFFSPHQYLLLGFET